MALEIMFNLIDQNKNGSIQYMEFVAATLRKKIVGKDLDDLLCMEINCDDKKQKPAAPVVTCS